MTDNADTNGQSDTAKATTLRFDGDSERMKWVSVVDTRLNQGASMSSAIAAADMYILALRARRGVA